MCFVLLNPSIEIKLIGILNPFKDSPDRWIWRMDRRSLSNRVSFYVLGTEWQK